MNRLPRKIFYFAFAHSWLGLSKPFLSLSQFKLFFYLTFFKTSFHILLFFSVFLTTRQNFGIFTEKSRVFKAFKLFLFFFAMKTLSWILHKTFDLEPCSDLCFYRFTHLGILKNCKHVNFPLNFFSILCIGQTVWN